LLRVALPPEGGIHAIGALLPIYAVGAAILALGLGGLVLNTVLLFRSRAPASKLVVRLVKGSAVVALTWVVGGLVVCGDLPFEGGVVLLGGVLLGAASIANLRRASR